MSNQPRVLNLTFIEDEVRRVQIAEDMALVWDAGFNDLPSEKYLVDGDSVVRWDHFCKVVDDEGGVVVQHRVAVFLSSGHKLIHSDPPTIEGSLRCLACNKHGFVAAGEWVEA